MVFEHFARLVQRRILTKLHKLIFTDDALIFEHVQLCSLFWCRVILQVGLDCHSVVAFCFKSNLQFAD